MDNNKKLALVTGANQGIGLHVAKELVANGYTVLIGSRNYDNGIKAAESIGAEAHAIQLDVTDNASVTAAANRIEKEYGRLDLLVNNAGVSQAGKPGTMAEVIARGQASKASLDEVKAVWETNVFAVITVTQAMLPLLYKSPAGRIVNVSSGMGSLTLNADPSFPYRKGFGAVYGASKTALNAITMAFAIELENTTIKVNAVTPGFTATALNNFEGTDSIEVGSLAVVKAALDEDGPTGTFTGPDGIFPW